MLGLADRLLSGKQVSKSHQQFSLNASRSFLPRELVILKGSRGITQQWDLRLCNTPNVGKGASWVMGLWSFPAVLSVMLLC